MTRIAGADQALLLLRAQLQRLQRTRGNKSGSSARTAPERPVERLKGLAALDELTEEEFRRTLVRALLSEELGEAVASDPAFQAVADDVFRILSEQDEGRALIDAAARAVREGQPEPRT